MDTLQQALTDLLDQTPETHQAYLARLSAVPREELSDPDGRYMMGTLLKTYRKADEPQTVQWIWQVVFHLVALGTPVRIAHVNYLIGKSPEKLQELMLSQLPNDPHNLLSLQNFNQMIREAGNELDAQALEVIEHVAEKAGRDPYKVMTSSLFNKLTGRDIEIRSEIEPTLACLEVVARQEGFDVNALFGGKRALHRSKHHRITQWLLDHGADVHLTTRDGHHTLLQAWINRADEGTIGLLLAHGAPLETGPTLKMLEEEAGQHRILETAWKRKHLGDIASQRSKAPSPSPRF